MVVGVFTDDPTQGLGMGLTHAYRRPSMKPWAASIWLGRVH